MTVSTDAVSELIRDVAQRIILPRFRNLAHGEVDTKAGGEIVTVVDNQSEAALSDQLRGGIRRHW